MYLFINFKSYRESIGKNALYLLKKMESSFPNNESIIPIFNPLDSLLETSFKKFIQHADPIEAGPFTGYIPVEVLIDYGYSGIMINHSEHRLNEESIEKTIKLAKKYGLETLLCAENLDEVRRFLSFEPDFIAYEPPDLIGGNISVSSTRPEIIKEASDIIGNRSIFVVGAGIKTRNDVMLSLKLGAEGVLVASGIVKSKDPISAIKEMLIDEL